MKCPGTGGECFDVFCLRGGCQGFDVRVEAVTVIHTSIATRRRPVSAEASLVAALPRPTHMRCIADGVACGVECPVASWEPA